MKKLVIVFLMVIYALSISAHKNVPHDLSELERMPLDRLEDGLCLTHWDPKVWGVSGIRPVEQARLIHERFMAKVKEVRAENASANFEVVGKSLDKEYDAKFVHQCAKLEQRKRKTGSYGTMWVTSTPFGVPVKCNAQTFYQNACCFDNFYQSLTDKQLEQLYRATAPQGLKNWLRDKFK